MQFGFLQFTQLIIYNEMNDSKKKMKEYMLKWESINLKKIYVNCLIAKYSLKWYVLRYLNTH